MATTLYNVILWSGSHKAAEILYQNAYPLKATDGLSSLDEGIENMVAAADALGVKPIISVGHRYNGKHSKHSWVWRGDQDWKERQSGLERAVAAER